MGEEVAGGHDRGRREPHVLVQHLGVVVAAAAQVGHQGVIGERLKIDGLDGAVGLDRRRLERPVPVAQLLPPDLLGERRLGPGKALGDLGRIKRRHPLVGEAVDVGHLERVDQHPVGAGELAGAALEGWRVDGAPVAGGRPGEVNRIEFPEAGAGGIEAKLGRGAGERQGQLRGDRMGLGGT